MSKTLDNKTLAKRSVLATKYNQERNRTYYLVHSTAGIEPAGAGSRVTAEKYGVLYHDDGETYGRWMKTQAEAETLFKQWSE